LENWTTDWEVEVKHSFGGLVEFFCNQLANTISLVFFMDQLTYYQDFCPENCPLVL